MKVIDMDIKELMPYKRNPRKNDGAVEAVANSIKEFGFYVPIVVDRNNEIICGHTRLKAAKKLKMKKVPVIRAEDLTPEQVKAFRIADNSVSEFAEWDISLLDGELKDILNIDMADFGLSLGADNELLVWDEGTGEQMTAQEYEKKEAEYQAKQIIGESNTEPEFEDNNEMFETVVVNPLDNIELCLFDGVGEYGIPELEAVETFEETPFITWAEFFNQEVKENRGGHGVHFFVDDYRFQNVWRNIDRYIPELLQMKYVITPDFSTYRNLPKAMRVWNHYRNMWVGAYIQKKAKEAGAGVQVIPNLLHYPQGEGWVLDGVPVGGVVAFSSVGTKNNDEDFQSMIDGYLRTYEKIKPSTVLWFGQVPEGIPGNIIRQNTFIDRYDELHKRQKEERKNGKVSSV